MSRDHRSRKQQRNDEFRCKRCRNMIANEAYGTKHRNHCPLCLWSLHVDRSPGDRDHHCQALMEPVGIWVKDGGEWAVIHRCTNCGEFRANRIAGDDSDWALMQLAARALANPPVPIDLL